MATLQINQTADWQLYWGIAPLPAGAVAIGTVEITKGRGHYRRGALIRLQSGIYVQGNGGSIRTLPQAAIADALPTTPR